MNKHFEFALKVRENPNVHYNCAQSMLCAYGDELNLTQEQAFNLGFNFGSGMKCGSTCGVITAGLMILGMKGINDPTVLNEFRNRIANNHEGMINCVDLLKRNAEKGGVKKVHCDKMIGEAIDLIDEISNR